MCSWCMTIGWSGRLEKWITRVVVWSYEREYECKCYIPRVV
jgi:hypothetical protein